MIWKYLSQQYPMIASKWKIILPVSFFVALFMLIFQPFGLDDYTGEYKMLLLGGYGIVTFIILIINLFLLPFLFHKTFLEPHWNVIKEILFLTWILCTIGLGNLIYSVVFIEFHLSFSTIIIFQVFTLAVGLIPITTLTIVKQNYLNSRNRKAAAELTASLSGRVPPAKEGQSLHFESENGKDGFEVHPKDLLLIKSDGNYITVFYRDDHNVNRTLLRNKLNYAEEILANVPSFFKCHRSYLVNMDQVVVVNGNSQGYRLRITGYEEEIPVARNNSNRLKEHIRR